jgi:tetratricopeptide (TPR) repeat protein
MGKCFKILSISTLASFSLLAQAEWTPRDGDLEFRGFDDIIKYYSFVGDFTKKPMERPVSEELFWRYPYKIPKNDYDILFDMDHPDKEMPTTVGDGRVFEHINLGRKLFLEGKYNGALASFLSAKARFGKDNQYLKRTEYFSAMAMMQSAKMRLAEVGGDFHHPSVKSTLSNATGFLNWSFVQTPPTDQDPALMAAAPKAYYNLAAIFHRYNQYAQAFSAAIEGVNFLRMQGSFELRSKLRRLIADIWIMNRSYLNAVQELDTMIREQSEPEDVVKGFSRVGDIYFDLNNYELADDAYGLAQGVARDKGKLLPAQLILRGEALFWMGQFDQAQKMIHFAMNSQTKNNVLGKLPEEYLPWASLRYADAYLARYRLAKNLKQDEEAAALLDQTKLSYFRVNHFYPHSEAAKIADIRRACLELPHYEGNNVRHARELLHQADKEVLPPGAQELAWACKTKSYAKWQRSNDMVQRIKDFAGKYPFSRFLMDLVDPLKQEQASKFDSYLKQNQPYLAIQFFEENRARLFSNMDDLTEAKLFALYFDQLAIHKAAEFWPSFRKIEKSSDDHLKSLVYLAESKVQQDSQLKVDQNKIDPKTMQDYLLRLKDVKISRDEKNKSYLRRFFLVAENEDQLKWIYRQVIDWPSANEDNICTDQMPILVKMNNRFVSNRSKKYVENELKTLLLGPMDDIKKDPSCMASLLDLEMKVLDQNPKTLADIWRSRVSWPVDLSLLRRFWLVSEKFAVSGLTEEAKTIWQHIVKVGPQDSFEVQYAKMRLDTSSTVNERLWH